MLEIKEQVGETTLRANIERILNMPTKFTDILVESDAPIMGKSPSGWMQIQDIQTPSSADVESFLHSTDLLFEDYLQQKKALNFGMELCDYRLRFNAFAVRAHHKYALAIRVIPIEIPSLESTGLNVSTIRLLLQDPRGLILVSGAVGSGKSTTQAVMIDELNETTNGHTITLEDPIEYIFKRKRSIITQRQVGVDVGSFNEGVYDAMRQRPSSILIGEIRDRETAEAAILAAESGVLVIGSLHANDAPGTIQKLLSLFGAEERGGVIHTLDNSLLGVISQILIPDIKMENWVLASEVICNNERQYSGMLDSTDKIRVQLESGKNAFDQSMAKSMLNLVRRGKTSKDSALSAVRGAIRSDLGKQLDRC